MGLMLVLGVAALVQIVCWIMVVIKMFGSGILTGILGIICGLYAFIWGWMNVGSVGRNVMIAWTTCLLIAIAVQFMGAGAAMMSTQP